MNELVPVQNMNDAMIRYETIRKEISDLVVAEDNEGIVTDFRKQLQKLRKYVTEKKIIDIYPYKKAWDDAKAPFDNALKEIVSIENELQKKHTIFLQKRQAERREWEEEQKRIATAKLKAEKLELESQAAIGIDTKIKEKIVEAKIEHVETTELKVRSRGATAVSTLKKEWTFEILEPKKVPRKLCVPKDSLIRSAVQSGIREIKGVRIYEKVSSRVY